MHYSIKKSKRIILLIFAISLLTGCGVQSPVNTTGGKAPDEYEKTATAASIPTKMSTATFQPTPTAIPSNTPTMYFTQTSRTTTISLPTPDRTKAKISANMPASFPCSAWGSNGCHWDFSIKFESKNGVGGTLNRIRRLFYSTKGGVYAIGNNTGWDTINLYIPPLGTVDYNSWIQTTNGGTPDLRRARVVITYEGNDDHGNFFTGTVKTTLASN